jgi:uncharacterized SAM-binding protein YcdF (DUF218 family)
MIDLLDFLRQNLKLAILPPGGIILLLLLGHLFGRRFLGRLFSWSGLLALYLLSIPVTSGWLAGQQTQYPPLSGEQLLARDAQAILVLTASQEDHNPELGGAPRPDALGLQRLSHALRLHRETGLPIILSGGAMREGEQPLAVTYAAWLGQLAGVETLATEERSHNTRENLEFSATLLHELQLERVALVTHAFHMPRAMLVAASQEAEFIPTPFSLADKPEAADEPRWLRWTPQSRTLAHNYLLLHELLGTFWYRVNR